MRMISVSELKVGQVLGKSIYGMHQKLILGAGYRISAEIRTRLIERGYSHVYIMEPGTEDVIPQDIISDEIRHHAVKAVTDKAEEIKRQLKFRDLSRTKIYQLLESGYLKNVPVMQDVRAVVTDVLSSIASAGTSFLNTMLLKSSNTYLTDHALNTAVISVLIGKKYGFSRNELSDLAVGAFLHDFGKIVLEKAEPKSEETCQDLMREHPTFGYLIVHNSHNASPIVCQVIKQHHEHQDGSGYPLGLTGENLPPTGTQKRTPGTIYRLAEIVTVADVFDNLAANPHRDKPLGPADAMKLLMEGRSVLYNSHIVSTLSRLVPAYPEGAVVRIRRLAAKGVTRSLNGCEAVVAKISENNLHRPVIVVFRDKFGKPVEPQAIDTATAKEVELELVL